MAPSNPHESIGLLRQVVADTVIATRSPLS
jgi:hypothetical protein